MKETFAHNGILLEYEVSGEDAPLVFLHGLGGGINQIDAVYEPVEKVRLITLNQQGHGNSGVNWERYDFDYLADDVVALLDHLHLEKAVFAGISMGAAVCLNIAVRYPQRVEKMLLIRNAWTDKPMAEEVCRAYWDMGQTLHRGGYEAFLRTKGWEIVSGATSYTRNAFTIPFQEVNNRKNWKKFLILPNKAPIVSLRSLQTVSVPVMILANRNDMCHPFEYGELIAQHIPGAVFREIPDKDSDAIGHKMQINQAIRDMMI